MKNVLFQSLEVLSNRTNHVLPRKQETQLSLSNLHDAFIGQSRSPNIAPFHMIDIVSYCTTVTLSFRYSTSKMS